MCSEGLGAFSDFSLNNKTTFVGDIRYQVYTAIKPKITRRVVTLLFRSIIFENPLQTQKKIGSCPTVDAKYLLNTAGIMYTVEESIQLTVINNISQMVRGWPLAPV